MFPCDNVSVPQNWKIPSSTRAQAQDTVANGETGGTNNNIERIFMQLHHVATILIQIEELYQDRSSRTGCCLTLNLEREREEPTAGRGHICIRLWSHTPHHRQCMFGAGLIQKHIHHGGGCLEWKNDRSGRIIHTRKESLSRVKSGWLLVAFDVVVMLQVPTRSL